MHYIADGHIHSYYSRATSRNLNLEHLNKWAQIKGLKVIATGDISHPKWLGEMRQKLEPGAEGFFKLRQEFAKTTQKEVPGSCSNEVHFILSGEISNIYKKNGRVRKIHNVVFFPSFEALEKFQKTLDRIGNIHSDGRPILGLDSRDLLEIVLDTDPQGHLIPAHIWTPWFSLLGSKSGFDSVEECFDDLTPHIFAVETGLSSDPPMNWRLSMLDSLTLVSNSDAHSPDKLAREANIFDCELSYESLFAALKNKAGDQFLGTIEFFPEEGKYHLDGHRKCNKRMHPQETIANNGLCPVCGLPAVLGVSYRVEELADRPEGTPSPGAKDFKSLIPLTEVLGEVMEVGAKSKKVMSSYFAMLRDLGPELEILMNLSLSDIRAHSGDLVAEAIDRMRSGRVKPVAGYDGEYGVIHIFDKNEREKILQQGTLFSLADTKTPNGPPEGVSKTLPLAEPTDDLETISGKSTRIKDGSKETYGLNEDQQKAVEHRGSPLIIQAGPGTGKTQTLTQRLVSLIKNNEAKAENILAITFTNKAAAEMRHRLNAIVGEKIAGQMTINTFHAFGLSILRATPHFFGRTSGFDVLDTAADDAFEKFVKKATFVKLNSANLEQISRLKCQYYSPDGIPKEIRENLPEELLEKYLIYEQSLMELNAVDYDDLVVLPVQILSKDADRRRELLNTFKIIAVDEFQDINQAQYDLFRLLSLTAYDVCVIGDPDQAIYGFRGANRKFFLDFHKDFPNATLMKLSRNYRSAKNILAASLQILNRDSANQDFLWSNIESKVHIEFSQSATERAEAEFVVHNIEKLVGGTSYFSLDSQRVDETAEENDYSFSDIAILMRTKNLAPPLIEALTRSGIPFESISMSNFASTHEVRLLADILKFKTSNFFDAMLARKITEHFCQHDQAAYAPLPAISLENEQSIYALAEKENVSGLKEAAQFFIDLRGLPAETSVVDLARFIWSRTIDKTEADQEDSNALLKKLVQFAEPYKTDVAAFIDSLLLQKDVDRIDERGEKVRLLTLHASKGLEFPVVFIVGLEEGLMPHQFPGEKTDLGEERRLLYVGMTRARSQLYLTHASSRIIFGQKTGRQPSRFLSAIAESLLRRQERRLPAKLRSRQLDLF